MTHVRRIGSVPFQCSEVLAAQGDRAGRAEHQAGAGERGLAVTRDGRDGLQNTRVTQSAGLTAFRSP